MSSDRYYNLCNKNIGAAVEITCFDGTTHRGIIERVDHSHVFLAPFDRKPSSHGSSYGTFLWGWGFAFAAGIALGSIATLAFLPFYYW